MLGFVATGNKKVVDVGKDEIEATKNMVDEALKSLCSIP